jgi:hypothetical protein
MTASRAAEQIWALVSGLPCGKRESTKIMMLQGYADDSGSEPQSTVFLLGGFVSTVSKWVTFSDEWDAALGLYPKIDYFRTTEAMNLRGQFDRKRGWNEQLRDKRISDLVEIIKANVEIGVHVFVNNETFHRLIAALPLPYRNLSSDIPYPLLFAQICLTVARLQFIFDAHDRCELIFDEQLGFEVEAMQWWRLFKKEASNSLTKYIGSPPSFKNDKKVRPLQAADLFAWHRRRFLEDGRGADVLESLEVIPQMMVPLSDRIIEELRTYLSESVAKFSEANPNVPLEVASKKARRRTRIMNRRSGASPSSSGDEPPC